MSWVILRSISTRTTFRKTPSNRVFDVPVFPHKRTPKVFANRELIPEIHNHLSELNKSKRSARQPIYNKLSKIINENIEDPDLTTIFTELAQKEGKSPLLDIIAKSHPEHTAKLLCQLDADTLSKINFDLTFSEFCNIAENVIVRKPVTLIPVLSKEEQEVQDISFIVPYDKKPKTWEYSFIDFVSRHVLDELLPEELDEQVFLWTSRKLYPIAKKQANKEGKFLQTFDYHVSGFLSSLLGMIVAKGSALNNWDDNMIADHVNAIGGNIVNLDSNMNIQEKIDFWAHFAAAVTHQEHIVHQKKTAYDIRVLHTLIGEISKTWIYEDRLALVDKATKLVERKGGLLSLLDYIKNMM